MWQRIARQMLLEEVAKRQARSRNSDVIDVEFEVIEDEVVQVEK